MQCPKYKLSMKIIVRTVVSILMSDGTRGVQQLGSGLENGLLVHYHEKKKFHIGSHLETKTYFKNLLFSPSIYTHKLSLFFSYSSRAQADNLNLFIHSHL